MEPEIIPPSLQAKLATLVHYCEMQRRNLLVTTASMVVNRLLDDPEVAQWADQQKDNLLYTVRAPR